MSNETNNEVTVERVKVIIAEHLGRSVDEITEDKTIEELGADSLDTVELVMALEEEIDGEIPDSEAEKLTTVKAVIDYVESRKVAGSAPAA